MNGFTVLESEKSLKLLRSFWLDSYLALAYPPKIKALLQKQASAKLLSYQKSILCYFESCVKLCQGDIHVVLILFRLTRKLILIISMVGMAICYAVLGACFYIRAGIFTG